MTIFSLAGTLLFETPTWAGIQGAMGQILYVGILSSGVAYTLQIMAQKDSDPAVISLLLSLESVFAAISGAVILGDRLSGREYFGCAVMLAAVVLAQLPEKKKAAGVTAKDHLDSEAEGLRCFSARRRGCPLEKRWSGVVYFILYYYGTGCHSGVRYHLLTGA